MDFDDAKENIQPLAAGRNASILQAALHADSPHELQQQRRHYEDYIKCYEGDDPLEPWFEYIYWIEQSFPSGGKESGLEEVLLKCLTKFEKNQRYHQDRRMIKLYIKYIDTHENPQECYQQLYNQGIGTMVADLYICWAYYFDLSGNFRKADQIFRKGIECRAQPLEELQEAHQHFGFTMSQRILYDDDNSKQIYKSTLQEKRYALTSLKSHKKKVGSVRTGAAVKNYAPGKIQLNSANPNTSSRRGNVSVHVFEDENHDPNTIPPSEPHAPDTSKSVVRTLLDSARKQENVKEPGPWNKAHDKKRGKLFVSEPRTDLGFEILEDEENLQPVKGKINYGKPFIQYAGFVRCNKPQEEWNLPVTLENEIRPHAYPSYDKCMLYPRPNMEYSPEELRAYQWCKRNGVENHFTKKYGMIWDRNLSTGIRMYPNFVKKNQPAIEEPKVRDFDPMAANANDDGKLVFDPKLCYPSNDEELQFEEIMYRRWKNGDRKLKYGGNETIAMSEEMEETICLPNEAARRKSFFPTRKSIAPPHFTRLPSNLDETVEETPKTSVPRRSVIMITPKKMERSDFPEPKASIQCYEDETDDSAFTFKTPAAPPMKQQKLNFQIYEEDENNYEANETCSTQVFNCFIKAQSVSTPKAPTKVIKPSLAERQQTNLNLSGTENVPLPVNPNPTAAFSLPEYNDAGLTLHSKQLSTIMETSEQVTGNTASTKSSMSSPEFEGEAQHSKTPHTNNVCTLDTVQEAGSLTENGEVLLMKSLRLDEETPTVRQYNEISHLEQREDTVPTMPAVKIFEEKTETVSKIILPKAGNFSRLEDKEDTTPSIKPVRFHEDKTETITKMILPPIKPAINEIPPDDEMLEFFAKSPERRTAPIKAFSSMFSPVSDKSLFTASSFMNFKDSPVAKLKCTYDSPELKSKHHSLIGVNKSKNQSFLPNFADQMEVDGGKKKKSLESSFLPNFSATSGDVERQKPANSSISIGTQCSSVTSGDLRRQQMEEDSATGSKMLLRQNKEDSFLRRDTLQWQQLGDNSFLPEFARESRGGVVSPTKKSTQDSFLSGFPSVTVGNNQPRDDSFMSYISNTESLKAKQAAEDSFMKKFSSATAADKPNKMSETSFNVKNNTVNSLMKFSSAEVNANPKKTMETSRHCDDYFTKNSKVTENSFTPNMSVHRRKEDSFMPNLSTISVAIPGQRVVDNKSMKSVKIAEDSFLPNLSYSCSPPNLSTKGAVVGQRVVGHSNLKHSPKATNAAERHRSEVAITKDLSFRGTLQTPHARKDSFTTSYTGPVEKLQRATHVSFLSQPKEVRKSTKDSFRLNLSKSPQQTNEMLFQDPRKPSEEEKPRRLSRIPQFQQRADVSKQLVPQMDRSQSNSTLSFLNSLNATEPRKQPDQVDKFSIFEDSNCQRTAPIVEAKQTNKFAIFEDSNNGRSSVKQSNKNVCFDVSLRPDDFFEDNIRTEAFATDLSMIKNSTWLPNHNPRQTQIQEQSLHIKDVMNISSNSRGEKSHGLSIFSSVPQEKSIDIMPPPPPPNMAPKFPIKATKAREVISDCIEIAESDDEENNDLGRSIYYTKTPKTPKMSRHNWSPESGQQTTPEVNAFVHRPVDLDYTQQVIDDYFVSNNVNPFNQDLLDAFLIQIDFTSYIEKVPTCEMVRRIKPLRKDSIVSISGRTFHVLKLIGEGSYGAVYCAKEQQSERMFALKQERPANLWEYYICLELRSRLRSTEILSGFLSIEYALIGNNAGILVSNCSRYGSLIAVCNKIKKVTLKNVDEYVVMHMASQLLLIIDHLHASNIIHADIKPDNFLLMEKLVPGRKQPTIQLIDFGTSIDMDLFKKNQTFRYIHQTESFKCVEMHEKRPWTYQLDLFGLAGVIHVLLFGKYMQIVKKVGGWTHTTNVPRYFNRPIWETIFYTLLNIDNCQTMPNLQNLRAQLEEEIVEKDKSVCQKIVEFNRALDM